jgi:hypothetical protein
MRCVTAGPPSRRLILVQGRARVRLMRARMAVVVLGVGGKDAIVAAAINRRNSQQHHYGHRWLNPTTTAINNDRYCLLEELKN